MEIRVCKCCGSAPYLLTRKLKRYGYEPKHCYRCRFCDSETKLYWNPEDAQMAWNQMNEPDEIQTNADKIRAMSDEELAARIYQLNTLNAEGRDFSLLFCDGKANCIDAAGDILCNDEREKACILCWLRRPAKEDDHAELDSDP